MLNDRFVEKNEGGFRRERSYQAPPQENRDWVLIDATNQTLGRLASQVAAILRGKHKPTFTPNVDNGDNVIVINASKIIVTGKKLDQKMYHHHSGYFGGLKSKSLRTVIENDPSDAVKRAINGMIPHTRLGNQIRTRLRVYNDAQHQHEAQNPKPYPLSN